VHDVEHVDDAFVLENLEEFGDLSGCVRVHTSLRPCYLLVQLYQSVVDHSIDGLQLETSSLLCNSIDLGTYNRQCFHESIYIHRLVSFCAPL